MRLPTLQAWTSIDCLGGSIMKLNYRRGQNRRLVAMRHRPGRHRFVDSDYQGLAIRKFRRKTRTVIRQAMAEDNVDNMILPRTLSEVEDPWRWD